MSDIKTVVNDFLIRLIFDQKGMRMILLAVLGLVLLVGLGCWGIGGNFADVTVDTSPKILKKSLDNGINFFDTADFMDMARAKKF